MTGLRTRTDYHNYLQFKVRKIRLFLLGWGREILVLLIVFDKPLR